MEPPDYKMLKRLDALLGIALTRSKGDENRSTEENVCYLRRLRLSNSEIAGILGTTVHYIEVIASKLIRQRKIPKDKAR